MGLCAAGRSDRGNMAGDAAMKKPDHYVFMQDEVKGIGTGFRGITERLVGRKWAWLTETATGDNFKLPVAKYTEIVSRSGKRLSIGGLRIVRHKFKRAE